jgi:hypothetical protein
VSAQTSGISGIEQINRAAKNVIFDSVMVRQVELIRERGSFNVPFQSRPTGKAVFAGDGELRVAQTEMSGEDLIICGFTQARMKLTDSLRH